MSVFPDLIFSIEAEKQQENSLKYLLLKGAAVLLIAGKAIDEEALVLTLIHSFLQQTDCHLKSSPCFPIFITDCE